MKLINGKLLIKATSFSGSLELPYTGLTVLMTTGQEVNPGDKGDGNLELGK
jgi:hypothetical protein